MKTTKEQRELLKINPHYQKATVYMTGCFVLQSIISTWWELAGEHLMAANILKYDFKHEYNTSKRAIDSFKYVLSKNMKKQDYAAFYKDYDTLEPVLRKSLEPVLRKYIFGELGELNNRNHDDDKDNK